ncbi:hypothetical protein SAMN05660742_113106 [Propionispira arboris]|uniref:Uncharacterized protein n=1 Tax=Propionispira arboris TaxID=84035 RepID=A0A1H7AQH4_9FIRM|nr:hypothetical protein SAMN05660742_113106 [Propionispira arboris]
MGNLHQNQKVNTLIFSYLLVEIDNVFGGYVDGRKPTFAYCK